MKHTAPITVITRSMGKIASPSAIDATSAAPAKTMEKRMAKNVNTEMPLSTVWMSAVRRVHYSRIVR